MGCYALLLLWFFYWLFIDSADSGKITTITQIQGQPPHVEEHYDARQHYQPAIPLIVGGIYGSLFGAVGAVADRRKPKATRFPNALVLWPMIATLSAAIIYALWAIIIPNDFFPSTTGFVPRTWMTLGSVLFLLLGGFFYTCLPAALSGVATALLISECRSLPETPPPLPATRTQN